MALGRNGKALTALQRACDLDALRFHANSKINAILRRVGGGAGKGVLFVNGDETLGRADFNWISGKIASASPPTEQPPIQFYMISIVLSY